MKIYISGKITGLDLKEAKAKFEESEKLLLKKGYVPINPFKCKKYKDGKTWSQYMVQDIEALLSCDGIYLQSDWRESKGARIEHYIAEEMSMQLLYEKALVVENKPKTVLKVWDLFHLKNKCSYCQTLIEGNNDAAVSATHCKFCGVKFFTN